MCLRKQGEGVIEYLFENKKAQKRTKLFASEADHTLVHALIFSAYRFKKQISDQVFVYVWEFCFGTDWRNFPMGVFGLERELPLFKFGKMVPLINFKSEFRYKALFYSSLIVRVCKSPYRVFDILKGQLDLADQVENRPPSEQESEDMKLLRSALNGDKFKDNCLSSPYLEQSLENFEKDDKIWLRPSK